MSDKKFRGRRNRRNNWFVPAEFWLFRGTDKSRNSVPNHSVEEKNAQNSVQCNEKRSNFSEFGSEPFRGREKCSEFRTVELKIEANYGNSVPKHSAGEIWNWTKESYFVVFWLRDKEPKFQRRQQDFCTFELYLSLSINCSYSATSTGSVYSSSEYFFCCQCSLRYTFIKQTYRLS
jgi:hypothetical protein